MKKNLLLLAAIVIFGTSCSNSTKQQQGNKETLVEQKDVDLPKDQIYTMDNLLANAETLVNKQVKVKGFVTHTCKHSGRRCFLANESQELTVRVEAKGNIGGFNRELVGSEIEVTGKLMERRLTVGEIDEMEKAINEKRVKDDGAAESCDAEMANVAQMREWMKKKGKDYYSIYYINGEEYNEL